MENRNIDIIKINKRNGKNQILSGNSQPRSISDSWIRCFRILEEFLNKN